MARPNKEIIGKLKYVYNDSMNIRIKDMDTLKISIPFYYEDEYNHLHTRNPHIDKIKEQFLIRVDFLGTTRWFKINQLTKQSSDSGDEFLISALSLESELRGKKMRNYDVVSYNCQQVMTNILSETLWTIGTIDPEFNVTFRDFDISLKSAVQIIYEEICDTFKAVAIFDTVNRTVSIVKETSIGTDLGLRIKFGQYMVSVTKESQTDDLITRLIPIGNDNLTISRVSENGSEYIDDFSFFIQNEYIEEPLLTSLNDYNDLLDSKKPISVLAEVGTTTTTIKLTAHGLSVGDYIVNRTLGRKTRKVLTVPDANSITVSEISDMTIGNEIIKYNSSTFGKLLFELEDLQAIELEKSTELTSLLTEKLIILDELTIQHNAKTIDSYSNTISNTSVTRTLSEVSASDKYAALVRISTTTGTSVTVNGVSKSFTANVWMVLGKITGATSHNVVVTTTQSNVVVKTMIVKISESEYSTSSNESDIINKYSDDNKQIAIDAKQSEIDTVNSDIAEKNSEISAFRTSVSYESNFTTEELDELKLYIFADEYRDENIVDDKDLYDIGVERLSEINSPSILYKTDIVNFLSSITEQKSWNKLNLGDTAKIIADHIGINVAVKIMEIEFDFENTNVNLTISNNKRIKSKDERAIDFIYDSINATRKLKLKLPDLENTKNNFSTRNDRNSTTPANPVIASDSTAIEHIINNDGSVDIYFSWSYDGSGDAYDIDGFYIYTYSLDKDNLYVFGSSISRQDFKTVKPTDRVYAIYGVPADKYYVFGVQAFRVVDSDISSTSILKSDIVQPSIFSENPYRPELNVSLNGIPVDSIAKTSGTIIIADSSTSSNPKRADYTVPVGSTSAQVTINEAIDSLSDNGGKIVLLDGTYVVDSNIIMKNNITLEGQGNSTVIKRDASFLHSTSGVINSDTTNGNVNIEIKNFILECNNVGWLGVFFRNVNNLRITNLSIINSPNQCVYVDISSSVIINNNFITNNGITIDSSSGTIVSSNRIQNVASDAITVQESSDNCTISGNNISLVKRSGIRSLNSNYTNISSNTITDLNGDPSWPSEAVVIYYSNSCNINGNTIAFVETNGITIDNSSSCTISSNYISDCNVFGSINLTVGNGILLIHDSNENSIQSNKIRKGTTNKQHYGINISSDLCDNNFISNNDLLLSGVDGSLSDSGTGTITVAGNRV